ncbi:hypothetical protein C8Q70DRAFT_252948 [Cubamyces menziesii]|nr:hypothetical protein C8Q70DRAFT_252948 [Cubamyces menziesii]
MPVLLKCLDIDAVVVDPGSADHDGGKGVIPGVLLNDRLVADLRLEICSCIAHGSWSNCLKN